jgi:zinc transport system substrate-binding protein
MRYVKPCFLLLVFVLWLPAALAAEPLRIFTVNYPLQYFAERIAGEHAEVVFPAPADVGPAFWMPDSETVSAYQRADLILLNGAGYAKWTERVSLPGLRTVDTSRGFRQNYLLADAGPTHSHGPSGDHSHAGIAFTTWLDFTQATEQARAILRALERRRPELKEVFTANFERLEQELNDLDRRLSRVGQKLTDQALLASHPVYQYLAGRYRLNLHSLMWEPDMSPSAEEWGRLRSMLKQHPARWMLWEDEPIPATLARLQALGVSPLVFSPGANRPAQGDFMGLMRQNIAELERVLL